MSATVVRITDGSPVRYSSRHTARERTNSIRQNLEAALVDLPASLAERDWEALGYPTPVAWAEAEFGDLLPVLARLDAAVRQSLSAAYRLEGYSTRVAAERLGVSPSQVSTDTKGLDLPPTKSRDGRTRPSRRQTVPQPVADVVTDVLYGGTVDTETVDDLAPHVQGVDRVTLALVAQQQDRGLTVKELLATVPEWHHGQASASLSRLFHRHKAIVPNGQSRNRCNAWVLPEWAPQP